MGALALVGSVHPLPDVQATRDAAIISFDILLYFQHIARVRDFRCLS